jgi:pimeloyl-ACP methyl ester carboxylesterase
MRLNLKRGYLFISILAVVLASCKTIDNRSQDNGSQDPYQNMAILNYGDNTAYEFKHENSDKLIIYIEGTGYYSVLGWNNDNQWDRLTMASHVVALLRDRYNILIPERLNMKIGLYYYYNPETRKNYTLENLVEAYTAVINEYLSRQAYSSIVLAGSSEGACILPLIYQNIKSKDRITGLVSVSYGGLSVYEQIKILGESALDMPVYYREACKNIEEYRRDIELYPDSIGEIMGYTYRWWNSFKDYRPFDDIINIDIPILFVHGLLDIMVPVESTRYIQENMGNKPFEFLYCEDADHYYRTRSSKEMFENDVVEWIGKHL